MIPAGPRHIVSLTPTTTETVFALGAGDRLAGRTDFDDYPPAAKAVPAVASYTSVDVEKIVGLGADLVLAGGNHFNDPTAIAKLRSLGIPVLVLYAPDVMTVLHDIDLVGAAVGEAAAAGTLTTALSADLRAVAQAQAPVGTDLVAFSLVMSACGSVVDADAVVEAARRVGATTFCDLTQAAGWMPLADERRLVRGA